MTTTTTQTPGAPALAPAQPTAPRSIPGLVKAIVSEKKPRSRAKKSKPSVSGLGEDVAAAVEADGVKTSATAPSDLSPALIASVEELEEVEEKKTSAVEAVQKRLRSANKKIQRIVTYEEKTEALNTDQKAAVATKPALEATVKELQELLVILKAEEAEDEARITRVKAFESKKQARAVAEAVAAAKTDSQNDLVLLFQFIHLNGLYTPGQGFAPPILPSVVANATGQEVAAVRTLYDSFSNGPLLGGHGDALEKLSKIASESTEDVIPGVSYSRIRELVAGITSSPEEIPATSSSLPAGPSDSVTALVDGAAEPTPSFLQESELTSELPASTTEEKVSSWVEDIPATTEEVPASAANGDVEISVPAEVTPVAAAENAWDAPTPVSLDWSEEHSSELPSLEGLTANTAEAPLAPAPVPEVESDGFTPARGARRGASGGERGTRGSFRGSRGGYRGGRGRGGFEGGDRAERPSDGTWTRTPREGGDNPRRGNFGNGNGFEGGRGGGRGRGNSRGGERGGFARGAAAPAAAAASESPAAAPAEKW